MVLCHKEKVSTMWLILNIFILKIYLLKMCAVHCTIYVLFQWLTIVCVCGYFNVLSFMQTKIEIVYFTVAFLFMLLDCLYNNSKKLLLLELSIYLFMLCPTTVYKLKKIISLNYWRTKNTKKEKKEKKEGNFFLLTFFFKIRIIATSIIILYKTRKEILFWKMRS